MQPQKSISHLDSWGIPRRLFISKEETNSATVIRCENVISLSLLLASDLMVGVGLRFALSLLLPAPFICNDTCFIDDRCQDDTEDEILNALHGNNRKKTDAGEHFCSIESTAGSCFAQPPFPVANQRKEMKISTVHSVGGLPNLGQTCYANSVLQALASLYPLCIFLDKLGSQRREHLKSSTGVEICSRSHLSTVLREIFQCINGCELSEHAPATDHNSSRTKHSLLSYFLYSTRSSLEATYMNQLLDIVSRNHSQFRSHSNKFCGASMTQQQDAHEFFSALMEELSSEQEIANEKSNGLSLRSSRLTLCDRNFDARGFNERVCECSQCESYRLTSLPLSNPEICKNSPINSKKKNCAGCPKPCLAELIHEKNLTCYFNEGNRNGPSSKEHAIEKHMLQIQDVEATKTGSHNLESLHTINRSSVAMNDTSGIHLITTQLESPFDGWTGSTLKCCTCSHTRPIRNVPFLNLTLSILGASFRRFGIPNSESVLLEDLLSAEFGLLAEPERVTDVLCASCTIRKKLQNLEEKQLLAQGAMSSVLRRKKIKSQHHQKQQLVDSEQADTKLGDIQGLLEESRRISTKITLLKTIDPDADIENNVVDDQDDSCVLDDGELTRNHGEQRPAQPKSRLILLRGDALKISLLSRPPNILCLHIQRRHYDQKYQRMMKVLRHVEFPEILDLTEYCAFTGETFWQRAAEISRENVDRCDVNQEKRIHYKLMSIVEHLGGASGGHYQTYRRLDIDSSSEIHFGAGHSKLMHQGEKLMEWVLVSDEKVSFRHWNDVRKCQAFMLFYVAIK